jgi:anti-anti-sigma factor
MEDFEKQILNNAVVINSYLTRATVKEAKDLKNIIDEEIVFDHFNLLIDLSLCEFIDSTFLGVLVYTHKKVDANGGKLNIVMSFETNLNLFFITSAFKFLHVFKTREEALQGFEAEEQLPVSQAV